MAMATNASFRGFALAAALGLLAACESTGTPAAPEGDAPTLAAAEYRLGSGDELHIAVFGQADLSGRFLVSGQGTIAFPLIGDVRAGGLTIAEFTRLMIERL